MSTRSLNAVGEGSGEYAPGFFCNKTAMFNLVLCLCVPVCVHRCGFTWSVGGSCGAALREAAAG